MNENNLPMLPQDLSAEQALLGAALMSSTDAEAAAEVIVTPEAFADEDHRIVWSLLQGMIHDRKPIDLVLMCNEARRRGVAGIDSVYLIHLAESFADRRNVRHYAEVVQEQYRKRRVISVARRAMEEAFSQLSDGREVANEFSQHLADIGADGVGDSIQEATTAMRAAPAAWASPSYGFLPSGLPVFDGLTGGLPMGEQVVLAGRPSTGKTSLGIFMSASVARAGHSVLFISAEMRMDRLVDRLISLGAERSASTMRQYDSPSDQVRHVDRAVRWLGGGKMFITDALRRDQDVLAAARTAIRRLDVKLIILDFLQLLTSTGHRHDSRSREVGSQASELKAIAQNEGVCMLTLSQLNRMSTHTGKAPLMSELRDSGEIEQAADMVLMLHRTSENDGRSIDELELTIAKNRNGVTGRIEGIRFNKPLTAFEHGAIGVADRPSGEGS